MKITSVNNIQTNTSFKQIHYTKHYPIAYLTTHARRNYTPEAIAWTIDNLFKDRNPNVKLKKIIEASPLFKNLDKSGDLYIHHHCLEGKNRLGQNTFTRFFTAIFNESNTKILKEPMQIQYASDTIESEDIWFEKLAKAIQSLPDSYNELKENIPSDETLTFSLNSSEDSIVMLVDNK